MLREYIERRNGNSQRVERASAYPAHQCSTFDQLVASRDVKNPLRLRADPVARAPDALQRYGNGARRAELHDQIDGTDIDTQLERRRCGNGAQLARSQAALHVEAGRARKTAVMRHHETVAEPLVERKGDAFAHATRAYENQRRAMSTDLLGDAVVDLTPHLFARDRTQLVGWDLDAKFHFAPMSDIDDRRRGTQEVARLPRSGRTVAERPMRCGRPPLSRATRSSRRASVSARCDPRLSAAIA